MKTSKPKAGDLEYIETDDLGEIQKDLCDVERMLKALIKSLEYKRLNPRPLVPFKIK